MIEEQIPEFSHVVPLSEIGAKAVHHSLAADDRQRAALARRFGLLSLDLLTAEVDLRSDGADYVASGRFEAELTQACIATDAVVPAHIAEIFTVRFIAETDQAPDVEIELGEGDCDTLFHNGRVIDLGETVAQTLGLAIDPYPRSPDAEAALKKAGVKEKGEVGPFAALAALRTADD